jgi:hypothetical protein
MTAWIHGTIAREGDGLMPLCPKSWTCVPVCPHRRRERDSATTLAKNKATKRSAEFPMKHVRSRSEGVAREERCSRWSLGQTIQNIVYCTEIRLRSVPCWGLVCSGLLRRTSVQWNSCCTTGFKIELPYAGANIFLVTVPLIYQPARRRYSLQIDLVHVI